MFSINIKRSVVTVGVVAGLLAAAGPAGAQGGGADFNRLASPGPRIGTSEVFELHTFGSFDPVEHRRGNDTQLAAGGAHGLKPDSSTVAVEGLKADSNEVAVDVWADPAADASNATGAVVAADFNYYERATGLTARLGSTKGSFIDGHSAAVESGYETKTPPHADGAALGFFDIPAELKSLGSSVERP